MLEVIKPFAIVFGSVVVNIGASSACLIILPFSLVYITVDMDELAPTCGFAIAPLPFIPCSIRPNLHSVPMPHIAKPVTSVNHSILESNWFSPLDVTLVDARVDL